VADLCHLSRHRSQKCSLKHPKQAIDASFEGVWSLLLYGLGARKT